MTIIVPLLETPRGVPKQFDVLPSKVISAALEALVGKEFQIINFDFVEEVDRTFVPLDQIPQFQESFPSSIAKSAAWPLRVGKVRQTKIRSLSVSATKTLPSAVILTPRGQLH